jgi:hypothetical protein
MRGSFQPGPPPYKDNFQPRSVPKPGPDLEAAIAAAARAERPIWFAPIGRPVPLLEFVAGPDPGLVCPIWLSLPRPMALAEFVAAAGFDRSCYLDRTGKRHERVDGRRLAAAYDADIAGGRDHHDDRPIRRDVQHGRRIAARLGVWPWAVFGARGALPRQWWRHPFPVLAWEHWRAAGSADAAGFTMEDA